MNRSGQHFLAWLLSICMIIMPMSGIAHARMMPQPDSQDTSLMPCHQVAQDAQQQICPKTGKLGCNCCDYVMPAAGLTRINVSPEILLYVAMIYQEAAPDSLLSQPQVPPYRPPRLSF